MKTWIAGAASLIAPLAAPTAHADGGLDPHMPNGGSLWRQGGLGDVALIPYCNGLPFADGSYWHQVPMPYFGVSQVKTFCKLHTGAWLQDAPEGGCGGEWP